MLKSRHVRSTTHLCGIASKTKVSVGDTHGFSHGFIASEAKPRHKRVFLRHAARKIILAETLPAAAQV